MLERNSSFDFPAAEEIITSIPNKYDPYLPAYRSDYVGTHLGNNGEVSFDSLDWSFVGVEAFDRGIYIGVNGELMIMAIPTAAGLSINNTPANYAAGGGEAPRYVMSPVAPTSPEVRDQIKNILYVGGEIVDTQSIRRPSRRTVATLLKSPFTGTPIGLSPGDDVPEPTDPPILTIKHRGPSRKYYRRKGCRPPVSGFSPRMIIEGFSAAMDENFGEGFYTVYDSVPHAGTYNGKSEEIKNDCGVFISEFSKFPQFNCVLRGEGVSIMQKCTSLIQQYNLDITLDEFTGKIALWGYVKYMLCYFLYGKFSVRFLFANGNKQFLADLEASTYADFEIIFTDPDIAGGYNKYFKHGTLPVPCN